MPIRVRCSACGSTMTVSEAAPMQLTCPRCLAKISRPAATVVQTPPIPIRAIPLDEEAESDSNLATPVIVLIGVFVVMGVCGMIISSSSYSGIAAPLGLILLVALAVVAGVASVRNLPKKAEAILVEVPGEQLPPEQVLSQVLNYSSIRHPPIGKAINSGWFIGGFFAALGVCLACMALLIASAMNNNQSALFVVVVVLCVGLAIWVASRIGKDPRRRGFGLGATVGMVLGLLALGPCAFCYMVLR